MNQVLNIPTIHEQGEEDEKIVICKSQVVESNINTTSDQDDSFESSNSSSMLEEPLKLPQQSQFQTKFEIQKKKSSKRIGSVSEEDRKSSIKSKKNESTKA